MEKLTLADGAEAGGEGGAEAPPPPAPTDAAEIPTEDQQDAPPEQEGAKEDDVEPKLPHTSSRGCHTCRVEVAAHVESRLPRKKSAAKKETLREGT